MKMNPLYDLDILPADAVLRPGQIQFANDSRFAQGSYSQTLTTYTVGGWNTVDFARELEFVAPEAPAPRRFSYKEWRNAEALLSDSGTDDDLRAIGAEFKRVELTTTESNSKLDNRGLTYRADYDEWAEIPNWDQLISGYLTSRLKLNSFRRAVTLLAAAGTNTARTWDTTAGKDPDQDIRTSLIAAANSGGLRPNRTLYGDTAWDKRMISYGAQNTAAGNASLGLTPEQLAGRQRTRGGVLVSESRYQNAAATKAEVVSNLVLSFTAYPGVMQMDPSNIKRWVGQTRGGGPIAVYVTPVGDKLVDITVEHYEKTLITSTLGIRKETIS